MYDELQEIDQRILRHAENALKRIYQDGWPEFAPAEMRLVKELLASRERILRTAMRRDELTETEVYRRCNTRTPGKNKQK